MQALLETAGAAAQSGDTALAIFVDELQYVSLDPGFDPRSVELTSLDLDLGGYTDADAPTFLRNVAEAMRQIPGVQAATVAAAMPTDDIVRLDRLEIPGATPSDGTAHFSARWNVVEPGYFDTLRIPLRRGRDFAASDRSGGELVAIVSEAAARAFWPGEEAVGQSLVLRGTGTSMMSRSDTDPNSSRQLLVIGVAGDVKMGRPDEPALPYVYLPLQQHHVPRLRVVVATRTASGRRVAADVQRILASIDPNLPIVTADTLENRIAIRMTLQRIAASLAGGLGLVGLLLAAIGIYGVTSYLVTRRTREIGIRLALGATDGHVIRMVLRQGLWLTGGGVAAGLVLATGASQVLVALLHGLPTSDPLTFISVGLLFAVVGLVACYLPVRRAARITAMEALRHE